MGKTISEKILSKASNSDSHAGSMVVADIDFAMAQDGTAPLTIQALQEMGIDKVWNRERIALVFDHNAPSPNEGVSKLHGMMREWGKKQGVILYDVGSGVCHQLLPEQGHVAPGGLIVGADSHTCTYGALGAFATGIGSTDMAVVFASGKLWFRVPETLLVSVNGKLPAGVYSEDIVLTIIGKVTASGANYMAVEYAGDTLKELSVEARMTLCNMAVEMGGKTGIIAPDSKTIEYVEKRLTKNQYQIFSSDQDADYTSRLEIDASDLVPVLSCPHAVDNVKPVTEVEGTSVDQVYIGTCTNGRIEDLRIAAKILKTEKTKAITIIVPASREIYLQALQEGLIETFVKAGAVVCNPGCGPCVGTHQGIPSPGYTVVSTANRNFKGRMGSDEAEIYLASPHTAAVTAIKGEITDPRTRP